MVHFLCDTYYFITKYVFFISDLKQEIQVHERHHADNNKSTERVCNNIVDSNKLQAELESNSPANQIVTQLPTNNTTTSPIKSMMYIFFVSFILQ